MKREKLPYYKHTDCATDRIYIFARAAEHAGALMKYGATKIATFVNDKEGRKSAKAFLAEKNSIK